MKNKPQAFTLIGLLAVIATSALLVLTLLPMLARSRQLSQLSICANNLKQLGTAINACADDRAQRFPPAILDDAAASGCNLTWDSWINHYIGGTLSASQLTTTTTPIAAAPQVMICPADPSNLPQYDTGGWGPPGTSTHRSYAMIAVGSQRGSPGLTTGEQNVDCNPPTQYPPLPPIDRGIGVWWTTYNGNLMANPAQRDWNAPGYPTRIIQDAARTILLAENANGDNYLGSAWGAAIQGPTNSGAGGTDSQIPILYQLNNQNNPLEEDVQGANGYIVYAAHGNKFNYLFHDNHVQCLTWQQTLGTTTQAQVANNTFLGMWTIKAGD
jgi:prepilin-type processing-associated H-X9-DG protein